MAKLLPVRNNIAVVRIKNKLESESGIIIESDRSVGADKAKIIAVSLAVTGYEVGQTLLIDWSKVHHNTIENNPVYILNVEDVLAVYEE